MIGKNTRDADVGSRVFIEEETSTAPEQGLKGRLVYNLGLRLQDKVFFSTKNMRDLDKTTAVIKGGQIYHPGAIEKALGIAPSK